MTIFFAEKVCEILCADTISSISPNYIEEVSNLRLLKTLRYAFKNSVYYNKKFQKCVRNNVPFEEYPVTTKLNLMNHFNQIVTDSNIHLSDVKDFISDPRNIGRKFMGKYYVWESSGTNGVQGIYLQDEACMQAYQALEATRKPIMSSYTHLLNQIFGTERIAYIGALNQHYASTASIEILKNTFPALKKIVRNFSIFESMHKLASELNKYQPSIIITYPSMASSLTGCSTLNIQPRELWLGGERLSKTQRLHIENDFYTKIFCSYGASEFLPIGWECRKGNLHVNSDWVLLEAVDEKYQPVPKGQISYTTLLTNLINEVQPIIRYDLGDRIRYFSKQCSCGSKLPYIQLMGRSSDVLHFTNDIGKEVKLPALAMLAIIEEQGIFNASLSQDSPTDLDIHLDYQSLPCTKIFSRIKEGVSIYLKHNGITKIHIKCTKSVHNINAYSGKLIQWSSSERPNTPENITRIH